MRQPGLRQAFQMLHAVRFRRRERRKSAAICLRHGGVGNAEIADMQFIQHGVFQRVQDRFLKRSPSFRLQSRVRQIHDLTARAVRRQADGIRIGHEKRLDLAAPEGEHLDFVTIKQVLPISSSGSLPHARPFLPVHHLRHLERAAVKLLVARGINVNMRFHRLRGRRPDAQRRRAIGKRDAKFTVKCIQIIEDSGGLDRSGVRQLAFLRFQRDRDGAGQRRCRVNLRRSNSGAAFQIGQIC